MQRLHPAAALGYFLAVLTGVLLCRHPVPPVLALLAGAALCVRTERRRGLRALLLLPLCLLAGALNPLFVHAGGTPLLYVNGHALTWEATLCGLHIAAVLGGTLLWCRLLSRVLTGDKVAYLFGRALPRLSLTLTLALRFVPLLRRRLRDTRRAQRCLYAAASPFGRAGRLLYSLTAWSLEHAIDTAAAMRARGYGVPGRPRTHFAIHRFTRRDAAFSLAGAALAALTLTAALAGGDALAFSFYPTVTPVSAAPAAWVFYGAFGALAALPLGVAPGAAGKKYT